MATNRRDLKGFIRIDYNHRDVPGSLILRKSMPKLGRWREVDVWECCTGTTTTTTSAYERPCVVYSLYAPGRQTILVYTDCDGQPVETPVIGLETFCAILGSVSVSSIEPYLLQIISYECTTTTTTSSSSTTTTTTTAAPTTTTTTTVGG